MAPSAVREVGSCTRRSHVLQKTSTTMVGRHGLGCPAVPASSISTPHCESRHSLDRADRAPAGRSSDNMKGRFLPCHLKGADHA